MRRALAFLIAYVLFGAASAAGQIIFPDKITSSRADAKLVDLNAIDGIPPISASECLQGNAGGDALEFGACGTTGGAVTAITADALSGLRSSLSNGTATLRVDPSRSTMLSVNAIAGTDQILLDDVSQGTRRLYAMTVSNFATHLAGGDNVILSNSNGELSVSSVIARDSELPSGIDLTLSGQELELEVTMRAHEPERHGNASHWRDERLRRSTEPTDHACVACVRHPDARRVELGAPIPDE